ncbi:unnamed protein product [Calypogeia fissa]
MDRLLGGMGLMDLDQELSRADVESVSSDNTVASGTNGNVQVVVRVRPPNSRERDQGYIKCVGVDSAAHSVSLNFRPQPRTFTFDYVADEAVGQEEIFTAVGKPITDACLQGYHCCLIAYGQTGAGKTFTMEGPDPESSPGGSPGFQAKANLKRHEKRGLIPRILDYIFQRMSTEKTQNCKDVEFVVKCSYLQIYNEQVSDLLDPGSYNLTIHEDAKHGMYVEGLQEVVVSTAEATYGVFRRGSENRHVGMTAMNLESSRSHSVFTVVVESQRRNDGGVMNRRTSRFYLVDLAGSERQKHSESAGIRLKEAGSINKSLSALGNVIKALVDISEGKIRHVPYRDSKLTFLLKDALGGNSKCTLIANVTPAEKNIDETLSTLKFAQRAKLIHNTAIVNEDMFGNPAVMGEEIRRLRLEIAALRANVGSGLGGDQHSMTGQEPQPESARTSRLEHIISQSVKRSLEAERKTEMDMHVLELKLQATQAMCERLEKTLQSQKMIIRLRENTIKRIESGRPSLQPDEILHDVREEIEQLRKQIEHHPDVVRFKMELDLCRGQLDEYEEERKDEELLAQIAQLENLNQTLKIEFQEMVEEKAKMSKDLEEVKSSRDMGMNQLTTFEEQFAMLREAVEKYKKEAADAVYKQEKAEERVQECTREQDEVWRRSNLAEAQATEYAQELTSLRSQAEKVKLAFNQQTKLQEEMFFELQKTTDELENSRHTVVSLQTKLDEANSIKAQVDIKLSQAEEERAKVTRSLEEMMTSCEQLSSSLKEKDGAHADLLSKLEQADVNAKSLDEKLSVMSVIKNEVEQSRDAALLHKEDLLKAISEQKEERELALEEERRLSAENMEKLRSEMDNEVQQISSILQSKLVQLEEMERLSSQQTHLLNEKENLRKTAEDEANELRQQVERRNSEISALQLNVQDKSSKLESSLSQLTSLQQDKETLESKLTELQEMSISLNAGKRDKDEADRRLLETTAILEEKKLNLEILSAENETLKSAIKDVEKNLLEMNLRFETLKGEHEAHLADKQTKEAELGRKVQELEAVTHQKSTLDACLSEELLRSATAESQVKELKQTIDKLHADLAVLDDLKSDLMKKANEVELLEQRAAEQLNKVILSETATQIAREDYNQLLTKVKSLEDDKGLLSVKIADLEVASTAMQGTNQRLEEEKNSFQTSMADLQQENQNVKAKETELRDLLHAKEEALQVNLAHLDDVNSKLQAKLEDLLKLQAELSEQSQQMESAGKVHQALENDHNQLAIAAKSLQDEKDMLSKDIAVKEAALKAMIDSIEAIKQEKAALQACLGPQLEDSDRSTDEQVKVVDTNYSANGGIQVCVDNGTNHSNHVVSENGDGMKKYSDEKEDERSLHEQETDARLVAALADLIDLKSFVAGYKTKLDLALKSQVQAEAQSFVAILRAKDLEAQLARLTNECIKLRDELGLKQNKVHALESELGVCQGREAELEKELQTSRISLESATAALENKTNESADFVKRIEEVRSDRQTLFEELMEVQVAKSMVENKLSSTESELVNAISKFTDLDGEVHLLRRRSEEAVNDALAKGNKVEVQRHEIYEIAQKLTQARDMVSEEQRRVAQLEETGLELEAQAKSLVAEKSDLRERMDLLEEQLAAAKESELFKNELQQRFEVLTAEKAKLIDGLCVQEVENDEISKEIEELTKKFVASEDQIAVLKKREFELNQTIDACNSKIYGLEVLLTKTVSDHEVELSALTSQIRDKEAEVCEIREQNMKIAVDLQELRDEVQYNLGEVEYEFQKHVIDTEARMVDLENQKEFVQAEASQLSARLSAENSKVATMLGTLEEQVFAHRGNVRTWVENFNSLESEVLHIRDETMKLEAFDAQVKQLGEALEQEQKTGREQKEEILHLQALLHDQAKKINPFSWSNTSAKPDAKSLLPVAQSMARVGPAAKEDFVPKSASQQRKRIATLSKDRPGGKPKTSYASQNKLQSLRALNESLPAATINAQQASRPQVRTRNALQGADKSKKLLSSATQTAAQSRQPLRPLSNNNNKDEMSRRSPVIITSRYNLRKREKVADELTSPEPPRNKKRRRLN